LREEELDFVLKEISKAAEALARNKMGALIAIEKDDPLAGFIESGVIVDGSVSADLIEAVFTPNNPLHDGGLIIQGSRIAAAGCLFPLTMNQDLSRIFGTRHRAALGLSEDTDAIIVVISEERQDISLVYGSKFYKDINSSELAERIKGIMRLGKKNG
jgi:diadenylate cyclase